MTNGTLSKGAYLSIGSPLVPLVPGLDDLGRLMRRTKVLFRSQTAQERREIRDSLMKLKTSSVRRLNDTHFAILTALVTIRPELWHPWEQTEEPVQRTWVNTIQGLNKFCRWLIKSWLESGETWTLKRVKSISKWARYYSAESEHNKPPPLLEGTIGWTPSGLRFPWLKGLFKSMDDRSKQKVRKNGSHGMAQFSMFGRGLPGGSKELSLETLQEHWSIISEEKPIPRGAGDSMREWAKCLTEIAPRTNPVPPMMHTSVSASASRESTVESGGKLGYVKREFTEKFLRSKVTEAYSGERIRELLTLQPGVIPPENDEETILTLVDRDGDPAIQVRQRDRDVILENLEALELWQILYQNHGPEFGIFKQPRSENPLEGVHGLGSGSGKLLILWAWTDLEKKGAFTYTNPEKPTLESNLRSMNLYLEKDWVRSEVKVNNLDAVAVPVPEKGFKVRVVTKTWSALTIIMHPSRDILFWVLESDPRARDSTRGAKSGSKLWDFLKDLGRNTSPQEIPWNRSTDWKTASDRVSFEVCRSILNGVLEGLKTLERFGKESRYLERTLPFITHPRTIRYEEQGVLRIKGIQSRGPLMGDPCTWALLSLMHLFIMDASKGVGPVNYLDRPISSLANRHNRPAERICGDDGVSFGSLEEVQKYGEISESFGMIPSPGADLVSQHIIWFTEEFAIRFKPGGTWTYTDMVRSKSFTGSDPKTEDRIIPWLTRGRAVAAQLGWFEVYGEEFLPRMLKSLLYMEYKEFLDNARRSTPIFLGVNEGGLGYPHAKGNAFVWRKRTPREIKRVLRYLVKDIDSPLGFLRMKSLTDLLASRSHGLPGEGQGDLDKLVASRVTQEIAWEVIKDPPQRGALFTTKAVTDRVQNHHDYVRSWASDNPNLTVTVYEVPEREVRNLARRLGYLPLDEWAEQIARAIQLGEGLLNGPSKSPMLTFRGYREQLNRRVEELIKREECESRESPGVRFEASRAEIEEALKKRCPFWIDTRDPYWNPKGFDLPALRL
jgi:hypothetical protein